MLKPIKLELHEEQKVYSREELYDLARRYDAQVVAYQEIKTDRYKIVKTYSGGYNLVMWQDKYVNSLGIHNLIIAESVPADGKR